MIKVGDLVKLKHDGVQGGMAVFVCRTPFEIPGRSGNFVEVVCAGGLPIPDVFREPIKEVQNAAALKNTEEWLKSRSLVCPVSMIARAVGIKDPSDHPWSMLSMPLPILPYTLGVAVTNTFEHEGRVFSTGQVGFLASRAKNGSTIQVHWHKYENLNRFSWWIPQDKVRLCVLKRVEDDSGRIAIQTIFEPLGSASSLSPIVEGCVVNYVGLDPPASPQGAMLLTGASAVALSNFSGKPHEVGIVSHDGHNRFKVCRGDLELLTAHPGELPSSWRLRPGTKVKIKASLRFKRLDLQGRHGKILFAPDLYNDVGVEFEENLGAGSLDGAGRHGHCLFIPGNLLEEEA